jgi:hypothetical protein
VSLVNLAGTQVTLGSNVTFTVNGSYTGGISSPVTTGLLFSATPNITLPGANPVPAINNTTGVFNTSQTGTFNVKVSVNTTVNGTTTTLSNTTTITVIQPPTSGPMLFTGFFDGTISAFSIDPTTGVLSNVAGYPVNATSASPSPLPVYSILANALQSMIYVSDFGAQNITLNITIPTTPPTTETLTFNNTTIFGCSLPVAANGTVTTAATAVDSQMNSTTSNITGDLAIVSGGVSSTVLRTAVYCAGNGTLASASNVCLTPILGNGTLDTKAIDTIQLDTGTTVHAIAGSPNSPWFFTCGPDSSSTSWLQSFAAQSGAGPACSLPGVNLTSLATDPSGVILVGINGTTPSSTAPNVVLFTVNTNNGTITTVQSYSTLFNGASATKVRTNGSLVAILSSGASQVAIYPIINGILPNSPVTLSTGPNPMDVDFDPTGQFLYVANSGVTSTISAFAITNSTTATPTFSPVSGSPFQSILPPGANLTALKVFN